MGDDVKEEPAKVSNPKCTGKAGWLKKSSGKFLSSYKDRFIHLNRTEIEVYENEDLKNCVERLDLENFEKCDELRSAFKKKNRLILIRAAKSGNKVSDVKLQAATQEEKDAWIKALSDAISRAKNKVFDEVKVDESLSLEHVTRTRPKGNRGRRPPTRIHMKEVANHSTDEVLRLDLSAADSTPNGTHSLGADGVDHKPRVSASKSLDDIPEESTSEDPKPPKKVLKPPMPPTKEKKESECQENESSPAECALQKKVVVPPMPPSKDKKPVKTTEEEKPSVDMQEQKALKPPTPPSKENKPRIASSGDTTEDNSSEDEAPQSKSRPAQEESPPLKISDDEDDEVVAERDVKEEDSKAGMVKITNNALKSQGVMWTSSSSLIDHDDSKSASLDGSQNAVTTLTPQTVLKSTAQSTPEVIKKSPGPPAPPKKKAMKPPVKVEDHTILQPVSSVETLPENMPAKETKTPSPEHTEHKIVIMSLSNTGVSHESDDKSALEVDKKSIDSGQISAEESESGDQVTPSTDKLQSSLEVLDGVTSEEELETSDGKVQSLAASTAQSSSASTNSSSKKKSSSVGDLLDIQVEVQVRDLKDLRSQVSVELEETGELLGKITSEGSPAGHGGSEGDRNPEVLLATAMEKLRKAEKFLQEATNLKEQENKSNRRSW